MTAAIVSTETRELLRSNSGQGRTYSWDGRQYASVTSIISNGVPKPALVGWAKKITAEYAVDNLDMLTALAENDPKGAVDWLKGAAYRQRDEAASKGTAIHEATERIAMGETFEDIYEESDKTTQAMLRQYEQFVEVVQPVYLAVEAVVYSTTHGYAGTLDAIVETEHEGILAQLGLDRPATLLLDLKSSKGVYAETGLQLAAYRYADFIGLEDGSEHPMLEVDGAAVLHIRPRSWKLIPVDTSEEVFKSFIRAAGVAHWAWEISKGVVGAPFVVGKA